MLSACFCYIIVALLYGNEGTNFLPLHQKHTLLLSFIVSGNVLCKNFDGVVYPYLARGEILLFVPRHRHAVRTHLTEAHMSMMTNNFNVRSNFMH